jgi:hypothetical protein
VRSLCGLAATSHDRRKWALLGGGDYKRFVLLIMSNARLKRELENPDILKVTPCLLLTFYQSARRKIPVRLLTSSTVL